MRRRAGSRLLPGSPRLRNEARFAAASENETGPTREWRVPRCVNTNPPPGGSVRPAAAFTVESGSGQSFRGSLGTV